MVNKINVSLKSIDYKLLMTLLIMGFIPTIYTTLRIFFLGNMPNDWGFNIASQLSWINLIYEILQESIMLPLFYIMGKSLLNKKELANEIKSGLIVIFIVYSFIAIVLMIFTEPLLTFMSQKNELIPATVTYIRLETLASIFATIVQFLTLTLITIKKETYLFAILGLQMCLTIILDTFLISTLSISMNIGVNGIAISNVLVNIALLIMALAFLNREGYPVSFNEKPSFGWMKEWLKVGGFSGLESFVRNIAFMLMVVRMVNVVEEQGTFWVANNFIWGWLLLPVIQLGQLIKRDCGTSGKEAIQQRTIGYFSITAIIVLIWIITIPFWEIFIKNVMNVENYTAVYRVAIISVIFYIMFAFNNVIDSIFYGIGKTNYMLFQSIVINTVFYGTLYILYTMGIYKPTLDLIALMFALGIAFDSILTYGMFVWMLKRQNIPIVG